MKLRECGLAAGPVYDPTDLMKDPALQESGMLIELDHPESGKRIVPGLPVTFSAMTAGLSASARDRCGFGAGTGRSAGIFPR